MIELTRPDRTRNGQERAWRLSWKYLHRAGVRCARSRWLLQLARRGLVRSISENCELELAIMHIERTGIVRLQVVLEVGQFQRGQERSLDLAVHAMGDVRQIPRGYALAIIRLRLYSTVFSY